jgi:short subunit dehydrogenase-like uncharacterized protein
VTGAQSGFTPGAALDPCPDAMATPATFLLYGATGYTGRLLVDSALARGMRPILGGRSAHKLRPFASDLGLEWRVAALDRPEELDRALDGVAVVVNAAGPFSSTTPPLIDACLRAGAHYLDVTGEVVAIDRASQRSAEARRRGVMIMPAAGFDVVASDCLIAHVVRSTKSPVRLFLGISGLALLSRGSARTIVEQLGQPVWVRRGGTLGQVPPGSLERDFDYGAGPRSSLAVSWGDVASAYYSTGIPDVTAYFEATGPVRAQVSMMRAIGGAPVVRAWQPWLALNVGLLPEGPTERQRAERQAVIVVEVEDAGGGVARSRLRTPEAFSFTASAAIAIVARVLAGDLETGFQTPARVYGPDFVLSLPRVVREDL